MWMVIKSFFQMLFANQVVKAAATVAVQDILTAGVNVVKAVAVAIPEADKLQMKGTDKLAYVVTEIKEEVQDLPTDMLTNVVTSVYRSLSTQGEIK